VESGQDADREPKSNHAILVEALLRRASRSAHAKRSAAVGEAVALNATVAGSKDTVEIPHADAEILPRKEYDMQTESQTGHAKLVKQLLKFASQPAHAKRAAAVREHLSLKSSAVQIDDVKPIGLPCTDAKLLTRSEHDTHSKEAPRRSEQIERLLKALSHSKRVASSGGVTTEDKFSAGSEEERIEARQMPFERHLDW